MVGVVKVAIRNREQLAVLRVRDGVIVMETMIWPDEIREPSFGFLDEDVTLRRPERDDGASHSSTACPATSTPKQFSDDYRAALQEVIDAKVEGREVLEPEEAQPTAGNVVDLMSALRASVEAAKKGRGEASGASSSSSTAKAPAAKKAAAKTAAKKATKAPAATKTAARTAAKKATKAPAAKKSGAKNVAKTVREDQARRRPRRPPPASPHERGQPASAHRRGATSR